MSHAPLELVIIMLGTNDTKERFNLTAFNIAQGITRVSLKAKHIQAGNQKSYPNILVIAPPPIGGKYSGAEVGKAMGKYCDIKSKEFPIHLKGLLENEQISFLDTNGLVSMNDIDYMHLDEKGHKLLAELVFNKVQEILSK